MVIVCHLFSIFISKAFLKSNFLITNLLEMKILLCIEPLKKQVLDDFSSHVEVQGGFETHIPKHLECSTV